jgi:hypothetical protein
MGAIPPPPKPIPTVLRYRLDAPTSDAPLWAITDTQNNEIVANLKAALPNAEYLAQKLCGDLNAVELSKPDPQPDVQTITIPVPAGTVNLLDPEVIARMQERGAEQNAAEHHLEKDDL